MTKRILVFLLVVGMSLCFIPTAKAYGYAYGEKTNTVDVYVGYFGSTYAYIGTVTEDEMQNNCYCDEWTYSSIDNGLFTRYNLAYGVTMESLLSYLNITTSDIGEIYFLGTDNNYWAGFTNLFGVRHYYFPNLAQNYNHEDPGASNSNLIRTGAVEVPAILAFEQSLYRDTGAFDYDKYKGMMDNDECLRIVFGQTLWDEVSTSDSVKWVYEIAVQLKGSPIKVENMEMDYGSSAALSDNYKVDSGYDELNTVIQNGLKIWSATPDVVTVDENGTLHAVSAGTGRIMFEYEDEGHTFSDTMFVTVGPEPEDNPGNQGSSGEEPEPPVPQPEEDTGDTENSGNTDQQNSDQKDSDQKDSDQKDSDQKDQDQKNQDQKNQDQNDQNDNNTTYSTDPGSDGGAGSGGNNTGAGGNGADGYGSGTGNADTGSGSGGGLLSESQGGTEGDDIGGGNPFLEGTGDSTVESMGENAEASVQTVDDEASENPASAKTVYLSLGNVAGGETAGGSVSGSGTTGGSGGKMLEIEELPIYYYVILIVALAALFVGGGMYRSLRFRKDIAR